MKEGNMAAVISNIDERILAFSKETNIYVYAFTREEVNHINDALMRFDLVQEIRGLLEEGK